MKVLIILILIMSSAWAESERIRPFESDGCSKWPEGSRNHPLAWEKCCFVHDLSYWMGGPKGERHKADKQLKQCVKASGHRFNAFLMYLGVRAGGLPSFPTSYRWAYGWMDKRWYRALSKAERAQVVEELDRLILSSPQSEWLAAFRKQHKI